MPNKDDDEAHKRAIIETPAKFIKSDIKKITDYTKDQYRSTSEVMVESALRYIPFSLHCMLQNLFAGKNNERKEASIGHAIIQAVRPRTVIAPFNLDSLSNCTIIFDPGFC